jgi:PAS domain S-box-containing protein
MRSAKVSADWLVALDAIADAIMVLNGEGTIIRCNRAAARVTGLPTDVLRGRHYRDAWAEVWSEPPEIPLGDEGPQPFSAEVSIGSGWYRLACHPCADDGGYGSDGKVVVVLTDITESKHYESELHSHAAQLERHNRRQIEFLGLLAHELRNPLAAIAAAAQDMAEERGAQGAKAQPNPNDIDLVAVIQRQSANLTHMVSDLLDLSRVSEGKIVLARVPTDLRNCVRAAAAAMHGAAARAGHELHVQLSAQPLVATVDATRIEQMLANLLDNSIKYTPPGGRIELRAMQDPCNPQGAAILEVQDSGEGLPVEALEEAFEMFVQYEQTLDRTKGGLGLGLTLVRRLAEVHGGRVDASSEGPGRGTTMRVRLPLSGASLEAKRGTDRVSPVPEGLEPRTVLLVEDNEDLRKLLSRRLRRAGHRILEASTGIEGRDLARRAQPDTVLLDVGLPGLDGFALAEQLRATPEFHATLLIALTGYGSDDVRDRARRSGFDAHLVKPVDFEHLLALVERRTESRL